MPFLLLFVIISFAEIYLFAHVGSLIGAFKTLALCFITAIIGGGLVKWQGMHTLMRAQNDLQSGKTPLNEIFNGICIIIAGFTLITPGFLTDIFGFLLLFPPFRYILKEYILKNMKLNAYSANNTQNHRENTVEGVIEGDYEHVSVNDNENNGDEKQ